MMYFFLYSENLDTIQYSKLTTFFILFVLPPRKNLVATALKHVKVGKHIVKYMR